MGLLLICIEFEGDCIGWLVVLLLCCLVGLVGLFWLYLVVLLGLVIVVKGVVKEGGYSLTFH